MITNNVLVGKDGWLFLHQGGHNQFAYLLGEKIVEEESIDNFSNNIKNRVSFCKARKIQYKHIVFPSKPLIKRKFLPEKFNVIESLYEKSYLPSLSTESVEAVWYLKDFLKKEEETYSTFLKYDTHMTDRANFSIASALATFAGVSELNENFYTSMFKVFRGDLSRLLDSEMLTSEETLKLNLKHPMIYEVGNREFLEGNSNKVFISHSFDADNKLRLLIFGDSFFKDLLKFLKPYFKDILFIRSSHIENDIVELYQPDIIFTGNAERYFSEVTLDSSRKGFLCQLYGNPNYHPSLEYLEALRANLSYKYNHNQYTSWLENIKTIVNYSLSLNKYKLNKDIKSLTSENHLKFESIGCDPNITYMHLDLKSKKRYLMTVNLISSTETIFQLFYEDSREEIPMLSEEKSIKRAVFKGSNYLVIVLDFPFLGTQLRVDPMNCLGEMEILNISLEEI